MFSASKKIALSIMATLFLTNAYASDFSKLEVIECLDTQNNSIKVDILNNVAEAQLDGIILERTAQIPSPDGDVQFFMNFLESGYDIFGSVVVSDDQSTFGTLGILSLDFTADPNETNYIVYIEAMTGNEIVKEMNCTFQFDQI